MIYTWEELIDSQDFEHGQQFVKLEDYEALEKKYLKTKKVADSRGWKGTIAYSECGNCGARDDGH